ncbi:MAG TPA: JAB domain-containing protein [Candidatus Saccharimonadales bacterium]|nr:JAB domain-containing protein [Candidatus Saccharimonadales bacterium]
MGKSKPLAATEDLLTPFKFIRTKRQEYFVCLSLDSGGKPLRRRTVTIGTLNATLVHPREVFAGPLQDRAAAVVIAHNHPSGDPEPSKDDIKTTQQLVAAGQLLGIKLVDHVIVTKHDYYSFRRSRLL